MIPPPNKHVKGVRAFWMRKHLPPGPTPLPFLGNVLEVGRGNIVKSMVKLSQKFGEVFTVYLGSHPVVVVSGYKFVKEVFLDKGNHFLNRGDIPSWNEFYKDSGIVCTHNITEWRELRKFTLYTLREMGFGQGNAEHLIQEVAQNLVAELRKTKESFINPYKHLSRASCKIIFSIMFGNRHDIENKDIDMVLTVVHETLKTFCSPWKQILTAAKCCISSLWKSTTKPTLRALFDKMNELQRMEDLLRLPQVALDKKKEMWSRWSAFLVSPEYRTLLHGETSQLTEDVPALERFGHYIEERVQLNKTTLDLNNPRNYVDVFLIKMEQESGNPHSFFCMRNLLANASQIFFAGVDSVSSTINYSLLLLMKHPDVLAKVQKEIEHVIGRNRSPVLQDRNDMPYTEAVLHELQRFIDIVPMGIIRRTTTEVTLNGYTLPKVTNVIAMMTSVLKDPNCFKYPTEFNPENFLNEKGEFQKNGAFMPLAAGKRICLGDLLVRMELFLFLVTLLQNFDLQSPIPLEELDITPNISQIGSFPKYYKAAFIPW
ncbi:cytochrome P450 2C16-like [Mantella aurantiaca]